MEVILLEKVEKLGNVGDVVTVKGGYGRNYLIPQEKALRATKDNVAYFESQRADIEKQNDERKKEAEAKAAKLEKLIVVLLMQAGEDGRLFGSVNARNIAKAVADSAVEINHKDITIAEPIKYLGVHPVKVTLHPEVVLTVHVNVARTEAEAKEAEKEFLNPKPKKEEKEEIAAVAEKAEEPKAEAEVDTEVPVEAAAPEAETASEDK